MNRLLIISWPSTRGWLKSRSALEAISITNEGRGIIIVNRNLYLNFARMSNKEGTMLSFLSSYLRERIVDRRIVVVFTRFTFCWKDFEILTRISYTTLACENTISFFRIASRLRRECRIGYSGMMVIIVIMYSVIITIYEVLNDYLTSLPRPNLNLHAISPR